MNEGMARNLDRQTVKWLAQTYLDADDPGEWMMLVEGLMPDVQVWYWWHPNLETMLPVLEREDGEKIWDVADAVIEHLEPKMR